METSGVSQHDSGRPGVEQVKHFAETARERATREVDQRKGSVAEALTQFASKVEDAFGEDASSTEQRLARQAASMARRMAQSIEDKSTEEFVADARGRIRESPVWAMAGFAALGFLGGRFLRGDGRHRR